MLSCSTEKLELCRPLIINMKKQEDQVHWTNNINYLKIGYLTNTYFYINPDLYKADRDALFLTRKKANRRRKTAAAAGEKKNISA